MHANTPNWTVCLLGISACRSKTVRIRNELGATVYFSTRNTRVSIRCNVQRRIPYPVQVIH
jgi:hypothetical protein